MPGPLVARKRQPLAQSRPKPARVPSSYRIEDTAAIPVPDYAFMAGATIIIDTSNPERWTPKVTVERKYRDDER